MTDYISRILTMLPISQCERTPDPPQYTHDLATKYAVTPTAEYRGTDGPIAVSFPSHITPALPALLDSLELNGLPRNPDSVRISFLMVRIMKT